MSSTKVAIMMGSKNDKSTMEEAEKVFDEFGVAYETKVLSAHRTPKETAAYAEGLKERGFQVVICGAGMSAALSGTVAAHTILPVIGVPLNASDLSGMDALLSTVQMPPGVPVGCMALGKAGAKNAAFFALRILGTNDPSLTKKLVSYGEEQRKKILEG
ncbi:MAG: 5-(carboxyamino)imidazole ribonucleotide mutase [Candidatus Omnitrophota bacterium]